MIRSAPDGYTLFLGHTGSISINPSLYANSGFDPRKDFTAIGLFASMPVALLAHPCFPAKTIGEVVELAKKEGGKLNIGTSAVGTGGYLSAELFKSITGVQATIVPYKGTAQLMNDLLGGHVPMAFGVLPPAMGNLAAGTLRGIAMLDKQRFSLLPNIPTSHESGLPGFESVLHYGLLGPAGLPRPIVDKLNAAMSQVAVHRRGEEADQQRGRRPADLDAGGIRRRHRPGGAQVGRADQEAQSEGGVMRIVSTIAAALLGAIARFRHRLRAGLSDPADHAGGAVPGGRRQRLRWPARSPSSMSRTLGQQVVVENRAAGGGGTVATRAAAKAAPDGYTILLTYTGTLAVNPTLYPNAGYDPRKDFAPIGLIGSQPSVLTLHPSLPVHSTAELVAYAKANPNKIDCGFVPGTIGHMTTELFAKNAGFEITRVPYKGNGTAIGDLIGGHITMMVLSIQTVVGNVTGRQAPRARRHHGRALQADARRADRFRNRRCRASRRRSVTGSRRRPARRARSSRG